MCVWGGEKSHHTGLTCAYVDDAKLISLQFLIFANFVNLVCIQFVSLHSCLIRYTKLFGFAILLHVKAVLKIYSSKKRNVASLVSVLGSFSNIPTCTCISISCLEKVIPNFPTIELSSFIWLTKFSFMLATHVGPLQGSTFQSRNMSSLVQLFQVLHEVQY